MVAKLQSKANCQIFHICNHSDERRECHLGIRLLKPFELLLSHRKVPKYFQAEN